MKQPKIIFLMISSLLIFNFLIISNSTAKSNNLRVFQINIWFDTTQVKNGFDKFVNAVIASKADIITLSEVKSKKSQFIPKLLEALHKKGVVYYGSSLDSNADTTIISKYPIVETFKHNIKSITDDGEAHLSSFHVKVDNTDILVNSIHLDYKSYALYLPRGYQGGTTKQFPYTSWDIIADSSGNPQPIIDEDLILKINLSSRRDEGIQYILDFIEQQKKLKKYDSIIIAGDFNEASHRDWIAATKNLNGHNGAIIKWNNTITLEKNGFIDSYRYLYPNPVEYPGITWPAAPQEYAKTTSWAPQADERDRIDFIFYKGNLRPLKSYLAGPKQTYSFNQKITSNSKDSFILYNTKWFSDHRGVITDFRIIK